MTKILHILTTLDPKAGGVSQAVRSIIRGLEAQGIVNETVTIEEPSTDHGDSFTSHRLGTGKTKWSYNPALKSWLKGNLRNYDIAILHGLWQYSSIALRTQLDTAPDTRVYVMPHGMLDPYFQRAGHRRLKALRNNVLWQVAERPMINGATGMLFTCEMEKQLARQTFPGYKPGKEIVTGLPVDQPPMFHPDMTEKILSLVGLDHVEPFLLFLGRVDEKKGVDLLVNAYVQLESEGLQLPALVIAGPGADTEFGQSVVAAAGKSSRIFFPGMLTGDAKWGAFYNCGLFVLPSHQENFGIAVAEALACEKPVLITDKINIYKEIEDGGAAIVITDSTEGVRSGLLAWIAKDTMQRNGMQASAAKVYRDNYEAGAQIRKFARLLEKNS